MAFTNQTNLIGILESFELLVVSGKRKSRTSWCGRASPTAASVVQQTHQPKYHQTNQNLNQFHQQSHWPPGSAARQIFANASHFRTRNSVRVSSASQILLQKVLDCDSQVLGQRFKPASCVCCSRLLCTKCTPRCFAFEARARSRCAQLSNEPKITSNGPVELIWHL